MKSCVEILVLFILAILFWFPVLNPPPNPPKPKAIIITKISIKPPIFFFVKFLNGFIIALLIYWSLKYQAID